ncbi:MAG: peptidyl-prolyl cis-trans isomerase [Planctomycetes bacterium]|nr:peptidyl-prolyl cis-trans isomerase [Planctomycetota bacterium]
MRVFLSLTLLLLLAACTSKSPDNTIEDSKKTTKPCAETVGEVAENDALKAMKESILELNSTPEVSDTTIEVQHLLISFRGTRTPATRSKEEAELLAADLLAQINAGADFDRLVKEHTDDSHPGIYGMTMSGGGDQSQKIYARSGMAPAFGNVGWKLAVGEVGVAPFSSAESPYGWHIIKRTK